MKLITLFLVVVLSACASTGPIYQPAPAPAPQDALIYVYRPANFVLSGRDAYFYVDDVNIVDLSTEGYSWFHVPAGNHTITQKWPFDVTLGFNTVNIGKEFRPSQTYYYRLEIDSFSFTFQFMFGIFNPYWRVTEVPEEQALAEIAVCKYQPASRLEQLPRDTVSVPLQNTAPEGPAMVDKEAPLPPPSEVAVPDLMPDPEPISTSAPETTSGTAPMPAPEPEQNDTETGNVWSPVDFEM